LTGQPEGNTTIKKYNKFKNYTNTTAFGTTVAVHISNGIGGTGRDRLTPGTAAVNGNDLRMLIRCT
jgi:hypothetical protein